MEIERFDEDKMPGDLVPSDGHQAFDPDPLPPELEMDTDLVSALTDAQKALSELSGIGRTIPNPHMLIRPFIRKEAVLSSRIEGTQADLSDVYAIEAGQEQLIREPQRVDAREIWNYVQATEEGLHRLEDDKLDIDLIRSLHGILLQGVRGEGKSPGEFRDRQNFIGPPGASISDSRYIPPPAPSAHYAMKNLGGYIRGNSDYPDLIDIGLIHYQIEAIHPFLDGNGRIGRLLVTLMICERDLLPDPFLYISEYLNRNRQDYFDALFKVSASGAWNEWLTFFLEGVEDQSQEAFIRSNELLKLREKYRERYQGTQSETLLQVIYKLFESPVVTVKQATKMIDDKTYQSVNSAVNQLREDGILEEITGKKRNRVFRATEIYDIISKPLEEIRGTHAGDEYIQVGLGEY